MPGDATEMYQEGLILPAVKIFEGGREEPSTCGASSSPTSGCRRRPRATSLAQTAGVQTGIRRFESLLDRYGPERLQQGIDEIIAYSERHMRSEIGRIPDGDYTFSDYMDTDGATGTPVRIQVTARKRGTDLVFDFTGSDPQVPGAVNCVYSVTLSVGLDRRAHGDRPEHPPERGRVRADHGDRAAGLRRQPGTARGDRQRPHRDVQPHRRHGLRRALVGDPGAGRRGRPRQLQRLHARRAEARGGRRRRRAVGRDPQPEGRLGRDGAARTAGRASRIRSRTAASSRPRRSSRTTR